MHSTTTTTSATNTRQQRQRQRKQHLRFSRSVSSSSSSFPPKQRQRSTKNATATTERKRGRGQRTALVASTSSSSSDIAGNPFEQSTQAASERQDLFNDIAPVYDQLNDVLSLGLHRAWKRATVKWSGARKGDTVLDVCCGSGDIAQRLSDRVGDKGTVFGLDFAENQLRRAAEKMEEKTPSTSNETNTAKIKWVQGDALDLPFEDDTFDATDQCLGKAIDVFQESINKVFCEYLVHPDYLKEQMAHYGFDLTEATDVAGKGPAENIHGTGTFESLYKTMLNENAQYGSSARRNYGTATRMCVEETQISFLNRYYVFKKNRQVDAKKVFETMMRKGGVGDGHGEDAKE